MANNLLDKASIILTPTAYDNGKALCVKPSDASGDFQFSRNSAATRVNAQGLVENVQILSSNLVQNGDFSEEGTEEVSNGSFTNGSTDWSLGTGWSIGEDKAIYDGSGYSGIGQIIPNLIGKIFKVQFDIIDYTSGTIRISPSNKESGSDIRYTNNGTYVEYYTSAQNRLDLQPQLFNGSITNISVKEVGQNWGVTETWGIKNNLATANANSTSQYLQQNFNITNGKKYLFSYEIIENTLNGNGASLSSSGGFGSVPLSNVIGTHEVYIDATNAAAAYALKIGISGTASSGIITITNISVIEITDDTNLPRISYEGFSYQDALGSEEVVNGSFDSDTAWGLGAGWSIGGGTANGLATLNPIYQAISGFEAGKKYKISFEVTSVTNGYIRVYAYEGASGTFTNIFSTTNLQTGTYEGIFEFGGTNKILRFYGSLGGFTGSIDNVSVKEYLGQEVVPDSGCGSWLWEPQSTNLVTYSSDFSQSVWRKRTSDSTQVPIITSNYAVSPDGLQNASRIVITKPSTENDYAVIDNFMSVTKSIGDKFTSSIYIKANSSDQVGKEVNFYAYDGSYLTLITYALTDSWARIDAVHTATTATSNMETLVLGKARSSVGGVSLANMATDFLISFAQLEQQSYATSYIPTSGSSVTRNQESCINATPEINSEEGVLYVEINAENVYSNSRYIALSDGTTSNRVIMGVSSNSTGTITCFVSSGGSTVAILSSTADITDFNKVALRYRKNNFSLFLNGVKASTDTSGLPPVELNRLTYGNGVPNATPFYGSTKDIQVYTKALSDAELIKLTT